MTCSKLSAIALLVSAIGAINWGAVGLFDLNLVVWFSMLIKLPILIKYIYIIVGISGLFSLFDAFACMFSK
ncbi:TPA: DUF378 domain-containing protein [Candidatus Dependentiae bacterium]|nr:DUF378 domain-containing protein [Candidatus Dependentiae bacterium]HCU00730.1 DUF378 domain-containing protein [Candidatus Dependentiae bacterium]